MRSFITAPWNIFLTTLPRRINSQSNNLVLCGEPPCSVYPCSCAVLSARTSLFLKASCPSGRRYREPFHRRTSPCTHDLGTPQSHCWEHPPHRRRRRVAYCNPSVSPAHRAGADLPPCPARWPALSAPPHGCGRRSTSAPTPQWACLGRHSAPLGSRHSGTVPSPQSHAGQLCRV